MIKARSGDLAFIGLTDVNLRRLEAGQPIRLSVSDLGREGAPAPKTLVIFHASRKALIDLAEATHTDVRDLLDQVGEG